MTDEGRGHGELTVAAAVPGDNPVRRGHGELTVAASAPNVASAKNCLTIGIGYNKKAQGARQEAAVAADPPGGGDGIKRPCKRIDDWVRGRGKWASRGRLMHSISSR